MVNASLITWPGILYFMSHDQPSLTLESCDQRSCDNWVMWPKWPICSTRTFSATISLSKVYQNSNTSVVPVNTTQSDPQLTGTLFILPGGFGRRYRILISICYNFITNNIHSDSHLIHYTRIHKLYTSRTQTQSNVHHIIITWASLVRTPGKNFLQLMQTMKIASSSIKIFLISWPWITRSRLCIVTGFILDSCIRCCTGNILW